MDKQRMETLLRAAYELLKRQDDTNLVINLLAEKVHYDGAECDGYCLMEEIAAELGLDESEDL